MLVKLDDGDSEYIDLDKELTTSLLLISGDRLEIKAIESANEILITLLSCVKIRHEQREMTIQNRDGQVITWQSKIET